MTNIPQIAQQRSNVLLRRWNANPMIQVQVEAPSALGQIANIDLDQTGNVAQLGARSTDNVVCVLPPHGTAGTHEASLWVRATYTGYRAAFGAFLEQQYGISNAAQQLQSYDIDHLLNRKRSPGGNTFIRLEAIPSAVNQAWGALFEKAASKPAFYANQNRERRTMSWPIAAKLAGLMPPSSPDDIPGIEGIANGLAIHGLNEEECVQGMTQMLEFAYGVADNAPGNTPRKNMVETW